MKKCRFIKTNQLCGKNHTMIPYVCDECGYKAHISYDYLTKHEYFLFNCHSKDYNAEHHEYMTRISKTIKWW